MTRVRVNIYLFYMRMEAKYFSEILVNFLKLHNITSLETVILVTILNSPRFLVIHLNVLNLSHRPK